MGKELRGRDRGENSCNKIGQKEKKGEHFEGPNFVAFIFNWPVPWRPYADNIRTGFITDQSFQELI